MDWAEGSGQRLNPRAAERMSGLADGGCSRSSGLEGIWILVPKPTPRPSQKVRLESFLGGKRQGETNFFVLLDL